VRRRGEGEGGKGGIPYKKEYPAAEYPKKLEI
jgi:hypothetical protein